MGLRAASSYANTQLNSISGGTPEVVLFTTAPLVLAADNATVIVAWSFMVTGGASVGLCNVRIRRGTTITGTLIAPTSWFVTLAAGSTYILSGWYADIPGVAQTPYSFTWSQNVGSSASTFIDGCLLAFVL